MNSRVLTTEEKISKRLPGVRINMSAPFNGDVYRFTAVDGKHKFEMVTCGLELLQNEKGFIAKFTKQFEESKNARLSQQAN